MAKTDKHSNSLNRAIIISILLHIILIILLTYNYVDELINPNSGESIDAYTVDPSIIRQQYQRLEKQKLQAKQTETVRKVSETRQNEEIDSQSAEDKRRLFELQKQRIKAEQEEKARLIAAKKAREAELQKEKEQAAKQAREAALKKEKEEAAKKLEEEKARQEAVKKQQAEQAKKEAQKVQKEVDSTLDDILSKQPSVSVNMTGEGESAATSVETDSYAAKISAAIENNFRDPTLYRNKTCTLRLILMPDGKVAKATAISGDQALCRVAEIAANSANIPPPPSKAVFQKMKSVEIIFRPE